MQHEMKVMDPTGHASVRWAPGNTEEVDVARETFNRMTDRGYRAFRVEGQDRRGERMISFDPQAREMILIPHLTGG